MEQYERSICNCLNLRRASQAITKVYDKFLEPSGLKISQYSLVKSINRLEPVNVSDLAVELKLDRTTLVRNLKPLEEKGLIADIAIKGSRNRQLVLTDDGKRALTKAFYLWQEAQTHVEECLGKNDLDTLLALLSKIENIDV
jgi:DNA-binding MarR family transcriptional regulator